MTPVTVTVDQIIAYGVTGYMFLHVMFGLVTHYHSALEVRRHNMSRIGGGTAYGVGPFKMLLLFVGRMTLGFPWFVLSRLVAPIGNRWHWSADDIRRWGG